MSDAMQQKQIALMTAKAIPHERLKKIRALIDQAIVTGMSFAEFGQEIRLLMGCNHE